MPLTLLVAVKPSHDNRKAVVEELNTDLSKISKKKVKSSMARSLPVKNLLYHRMWVQLSATYSNVLK